MTFPSFSAGEILSATDMNAVGMWLISSTSWSGTSSVTVDNVFSSQYDAYHIMVTAGVSASTGDISMTLGPSSSSNYASVLVFSLYSNTPQASGGTGAPSWGVAGGSGAGFVLVNADIYAPNLAQWTSIGANVSTPTGAGYFAGNFRGSNVFTNFTLTASSTVTSATVRVYGYRK